MNAFKCIAASAVVALSVGAAQAETLSSAQLLNEFNVIVFDDMYSASQHVDGRGYVGGDLKAPNNATFFLNANKTAPSDFDALYVGGNVRGTAKIENGGSGQILGDADAVQINGSGGSLSVGGKLGKGHNYSNVGNNYDVWVGENVSRLTMNNGSVLKVGGNIINSNVNNAQVTVGGTVAHSNINNSTVTHAPVSKPTNTMPELSTVQSLLTSTSDQLATVARESDLTPAVLDGTKVAFSASGSGTTYYNVGSTDFNSWSEIKFALDPDATLVINVDVADGVDDLNLRANVTSPASLASQVLWNFNNIASLGLSRTIVGSVLAPDADVSVYASAEGAIVANSLNVISGEVHSQPFKGQLPPSPSAVPVPAALPLMLLGLGGLGAMGLRRRKS